MPGIFDNVTEKIGMTPVGMGMAGLSVAGQIFGAIKSAKQNKANQALLNKKQEENKAEYNLSANQSFLDTNVAKDAVRTQKEALQDNQKAVAGRAAITGASDEAKVAGETGVQKNYSDAISHLASAGTAYQDSQKRMYLARKDSIDNMQMQLNNQKAEGASNLMSNAGDLLSTVAMTEGMKKTGNQMEGMKKTKNPLEGLNQFGRTTELEQGVQNIAKSAFSSIKNTINDRRPKTLLVSP